MRIGDVSVEETFFVDMNVVYLHMGTELQKRIFLNEVDTENLRRILNHQHDFRLGIKDVARLSVIYLKTPYLFISMPVGLLSRVQRKRPLKWFQERWG